MTDREEWEAVGRALQTDVAIGWMYGHDFCELIESIELNRSICHDLAFRCEDSITRTSLVALADIYSLLAGIIAGEQKSKELYGYPFSTN